MMLKNKLSPIEKKTIIRLLDYKNEDFAEKYKKNLTPEISIQTGWQTAKMIEASPAPYIKKKRWDYLDYRLVTQKNLVEMDYLSYKDDHNRKLKVKVYRLKKNSSTLKQIWITSDYNKFFIKFLTSNYYQDNQDFYDAELKKYIDIFLQNYETSIDYALLFKHWTPFLKYTGLFTKYLEDPEQFKKEIKGQYIILRGLFHNETALDKYRQRVWLLNTHFSMLLVHLFTPTNLWDQITIENQPIGPVFHKLYSMFLDATDRAIQVSNKLNLHKRHITHPTSILSETQRYIEQMEASNKE